MTMTAAQPQTKQEKIQLLERRITESELKPSEFAWMVLTREPRTMRRWLNGDNPIPNKVLEFLVDPWRSPWPE